MSVDSEWNNIIDIISDDSYINLFALSPYSTDCLNNQVIASATAEAAVLGSIPRSG